MRIERAMRGLSALIARNPKRSADIFQSVGITVAALVTAAWAIYTFSALSEVNHAHAELAKLEQDAAGEPSIKSSISVVQVAGSKVGARNLIIHISLTNVGTRSIPLTLSHWPLQVSRVTLDASQVLVQKRVFRAHTYMWFDDKRYAHATHALLLRAAGGREVLPYLVAVDAPGTYLISFAPPVEKSEQADISVKAKEINLKNFPKGWEYGTSDLIDVT